MLKWERTKIYSANYVQLINDQNFWCIFKCDKKNLSTWFFQGELEKKGERERDTHSATDLRHAGYQL